MKNSTLQSKFLAQAISDGHAKFTGEGKTQRIVYLSINHSERYSDPEEQVRAEFWAELIYRYGYEPARIGVEVLCLIEPLKTLPTLSYFTMIHELVLMPLSSAKPMESVTQSLHKLWNRLAAMERGQS
jgi:hypothetical protein